MHLRSLALSHGSRLIRGRLRVWPTVVCSYERSLVADFLCCHCAEPTCPAKFYSLLPATNVWAQITGWIGVVLLPVVMALRLSIPKYDGSIFICAHVRETLLRFRQFPANLVILMMWGWWMFSWGLVISTLAGGYRKVVWLWRAVAA